MIGQLWRGNSYVATSSIYRCCKPIGKFILWFKINIFVPVKYNSRVIQNVTNYPFSKVPYFVVTMHRPGVDGNLTMISWYFSPVADWLKDSPVPYSFVVTGEIPMLTLGLCTHYYCLVHSLYISVRSVFQQPVTCEFLYHAYLHCNWDLKDTDPTWVFDFTHNTIIVWIRYMRKLRVN